MATQRRRQLPRKRFITAIIAILLLSGAALLWILNTEHRIQGDWSNILPIGFTVLGVIFAFLAWLFPFSPDQHEAYHLPLASELVRSSFKMGDESAANFPYITAPIQTVYTLAKQTLLESSTGASYKRGILIVGEANAGKTRLAFEALTRILPGWPVLRWWQDSTLDKMSLHGKHLVIFIDDLQDYVSSESREADLKIFAADPRTITLRTSLEKVRQEIPRVVVVATCRLEDKERVQAELGQLFNELEVLQLPTFTVDVHNPEVTSIITEFQTHGSTHREDWDGTLGSLVLGLSTKNHEYLKIRNAPAAVILRAMKLLTKANIFRHTERHLLAVCSEIFGQKILLSDEQKWQEAKNLLMQEQFVTEEVDQNSQEFILVIRKDTYFDKVITDYPTFIRPHQLLRDLVRLQNILVVLKDSSGLNNLGTTLTYLRRYEEALQAIEQAIELAPNDARAYLSKGNALAYLRRYEEALQAIEQAIALDQTIALAYHHKGVALRYLERHEEALQAYEQAIALAPNDAGDYLNKGILLDNLGRHEEALHAIEQAIALVPYDARAYNDKGTALVYLGRNEEALQAYEQAVELAPNDAPLHLNKGVPLLQLKRYEEALNAFDNGIRLDPNYDYAYYWKGCTFNKLKRYPEALNAFDQAIRLNPNYSSAYFWKGCTFNELKRYQEALDAFDHAIRLDPNYTKAYFFKGRAFSELKRYQEALGAYEQAIRLDPNYAKAYFFKGVTLNKLGRHEVALPALERAVELDPKDADASYSKGLALGCLKRNEEALQAFERAIELNLKDARAYFGKGVALAYLERNEEALKAFEQAIELDPNYADAYYNKGVALAYLKRNEEALKAFEQAIELNPKDARIYVGMGLALAYLERNEEALKAFERAIELNPKDESIQSKKMKLVQNLGYKEDAHLG